MEPCNSSGLKSADAVIYSKPCIYYGAKLLSDSANDATLIIYDNASAASGTVVDKVQLLASLLWDESLNVCGVVCNNGIYADMTGTGVNYIVYFKPI